EGNDVGILFDVSGFAQVGHHRTLILSRIDTSGKLRKEDDWDSEIECKQFKFPCDFTDFKIPPILSDKCRPNQLEIIDEDEGLMVGMIIGIVPDFCAYGCQCVFRIMDFYLPVG